VGKTVSIQVIQDHHLLTLVAIPPLILGLDEYGVRVLLPSESCLPSSRGSPQPYTSTFFKIHRFKILLMNPFQILVVFDIDFRGDGIEVTLLGRLPHLIPVRLIVTLHWTCTVLPRPLEPCILLHAVSMGTIVHLDRFPMRARAKFLDETQPLRFVKIQEELNMGGSLLALLQLADCIDAFTLLVNAL